MADCMSTTALRMAAVSALSAAFSFCRLTVAEPERDSSDKRRSQRRSSRSNASS
jgi:hypothetical protein